MIKSFKINSKWKFFAVIAAFLAVGFGLLSAKPAAAYGSTLNPGESLTNWGKIESPSGQFALIMQSDGNLVNYFWPHAYWASNTSGGSNANSTLVMQGDGNLVIYRPGGIPIWASGTYSPGAYLIIQDDGNIVMRAASGNVIWSPNSVPTRLVSGQLLRGNSNWQIFSPNRRYRMVMQSDGNVVLYDGGVAIWAKHGAGQNATLEMQTDGNLVLYNSSHNAIWATNAFGPNGSYLEGQNDGNFVVYTPSRGVLWSTRGDSMPTSAQLAQQILNKSNRIALATVHVSGVQDNATARQNIIDVSNGIGAARSSYGGAPGGRTALNLNVLQTLLSLSDIMTISVSEIAGGSHSANSAHYSGRAFDINRINGGVVTSGNSGAAVNHCLARGASYAAYENGNHVHCQWP